MKKVYLDMQSLILFINVPISFYEEILGKMNVFVKMIGLILEDEGMHAFEYWGGEYHPLEELIKEMDEIKKKNK